MSASFAKWITAPREKPHTRSTRRSIVTMAGRSGRRGQIVTPQERAEFLKHLEDPTEESSLSSPEESLQEQAQPPKTETKRSTRSSRTTSGRSSSRASDKASSSRNHIQKHEEGCRVCGKDDDHNNLMICEQCNNEYHFYCLEPPLKAVPTSDWFCEKCRPKSTGAIADQDDGLEALVCALPPRFTERFGEIVWAQGGVGFGWWPACIYDPRLTVGGARELARKNLGKKHLAYFFECHMAPFSVLVESKLVPWEKGLAEGNHLGKAAHAHGKARGMQFRQALHIACMEDAKPIENRMVWNHTGEETPRIDQGPELVLSPSKKRREPPPKRKRGRPRKEKPAPAQEADAQPDTKPRRKSRRQSPEASPPEASSPGSASRTNLMHAIAVHSSPAKKAALEELFCRVLKRETDASNNDVDERLGFITLESHDATFEDARATILLEMDPQSLPGETWKFYLPSLGPVSHRQEQRLGPIAAFLKKTFDRRLGDGTIDNPLHLVLVGVP